MKIYPNPDPVAGGDVILMYKGLVADIPALYPGWQLCDGTNGLPDLRDSFVVGAPAGANPGGTVGANTLALAAANLPAISTGAGTSHGHIQNSHNHTQDGHNHTQDGHLHAETTQFKGKIPANSNRNISIAVVGGTGNLDGTGPSAENAASATATNQAATATNQATTPTNQAEAAHTHPLGGSGTAFDNRPLAYKLAFIGKAA